MKYLEGERPNKAGRIMLPDFKWCYKAIAIKTVGYWHKDRLTDQWKRTDSLKIDPHAYGQLFCNKGRKNNNGGKAVSLINSAVFVFILP